VTPTTDGEAQGRDALSTAVRVLLTLGGVSVTLTTTAILVRAASLSLDPITAPAVVQTAWYGDPVELIFLGVRSLIAWPTVMLVGLWLIIPSLFRRHMARARLRPRLRAYVQEAEDTHRRSREIFAEFLRTNPTPRLKQDAERLAAETAEAAEEGRAIGTALAENPLPHDTREYPVHAFGIYFASRKVFVGFLLGVAYLALAVTFVLDFPDGFIGMLAATVVVWLLLSAAVTDGRLRSGRGTVAVAIAVIATLATSALTYRLPVGDYEWSASSGLRDGRYALVAGDDTIYVVPCSAPDEVIAVRASEVVSLRIEPTLPTESRSLYGAFSARDWPSFSPLSACESAPGR